MARKCFISYKKEDQEYKDAIQNSRLIDMVDKSLDEPIDSTDFDYIMKCIRRDYLSDSTVTIFLIGERSAESFGEFEQRFIKAELRASLYDGENSPRSGILGIVLPNMYDKIYTGSNPCAQCRNTITYLNLGDETAIREFHVNYHIPNGMCHFGEDDRYCVMVKWEDFMSDPNKYIDQAFEKRAHNVAKKVTVRP